MGFIPILVTMSGAIMLFFMVVNYHLKAKKNQIGQLKGEIFAGIGKLGNQTNPSTEITPDTSSINLEENYIKAKRSIGEGQAQFFKNEIQSPYLKAKLLTLQYNTLVKTKPYSFVAKLLGHHPL